MNDETVNDIPVVESTERLTAELLAAVPIGVEGAGHRIFRARLIAAGDSKNGRRYPLPVLHAAATLYEGTKAYDHHRTLEELTTSTVTGLVGAWRNITATLDGLEGDLVLLPSAAHIAEALDLSLIQQAAGLAPLVGISHDVQARFRTVAAEGASVVEATEIVSVWSTDVVADPAAGGQAMRMVAGGTNNNVQPSAEEDPMDLDSLVKVIEGASAEERAKMATLLTPAAPAPTPAPDVAPVPVFARESVIGGVMIDAAAGKANLPDQAKAALVATLPAEFTEADLAKAVDTARRFVEAGGDVPTPRTTLTVTADEMDRKRARLDLTFGFEQTGGELRLVPAWRRSEGYVSIKQAFADITGLREYDPLAGDYAKTILRESYLGGRLESGRTSESVATSSWGQILGDSVTRSLIAAYRSRNLTEVLELASTVKPVTDFRTQRAVRMGGYGTLPAVLEGAPYQPLTSATDEEATYTPSKRGGTEDLTYEAIRNDDIGAVTRIPPALAYAAAHTLFLYVVDTLIRSNPTLAYDSTALFDATHSNTGTTALSAASLSATRALMRVQTEYGVSTRATSIVPKFLMVPPELEELAYHLTVSPTAYIASTSAASDKPNLHVGMRAIVVDDWADGTDWYLVADPMLTPTMELGFLDGRVEPELFVQDAATEGSAFTADKVTWKIRHIYAGTPVDHRAFYRQVVTGS